MTCWLAQEKTDLGLGRHLAQMTWVLHLTGASCVSGGTTVTCPGQTQRSCCWREMSRTPSWSESRCPNPETLSCRSSPTRRARLEERGSPTSRSCVRCLARPCVCVCVSVCDHVCLGHTRWGIHETRGGFGQCFVLKRSHKNRFSPCRHAEGYSRSCVVLYEIGLKSHFPCLMQ